MKLPIKSNCIRDDAYLTPGRRIKNNTPGEAQISNALLAIKFFQYVSMINKMADALQEAPRFPLLHDYPPWQTALINKQMT